MCTFLAVSSSLERLLEILQVFCTAIYAILESEKVAVVDGILEIEGRYGLRLVFVAIFFFFRLNELRLKFMAGCVGASVSTSLCVVSSCGFLSPE